MPSTDPSQGHRGWKNQRLPCLGLLALALGGATLGTLLPAFLPGWGALALLLGAVSLARASNAVFRLFVVLSFASFSALQISSPENAALAHWIEARTQVATVEGRVLSGPEAVAGAPEHWRFRLATSRLEMAGTKLPLQIEVNVRWIGPPPGYGDAVKLTGSLRLIPPPRNPGEFDFARWQRAQGRWFELRTYRADDGVVLQKGEGNPVVRLAISARDKISRLVGLGVEAHWPVPVAVIRAMTLGDSAALPPEFEQNFKRTGTMHLFAVSGLHVGMIALILWFLLGMLPVPSSWKIPVLIALLAFYSLVTGLRPPSVRAAFMASLVLAGFLFRRPALPLNSLGAAGLLLLAFDPAQAFNPGFQLSFCVVAALLLAALPLQKVLVLHLSPDPFLPRQLYRWPSKCRVALARYGGGLAAISLVAWAASAPLTSWYFHLLSLSAPVVNLLAVPLAFGVLSLAMASVVAGSIWPFAAECLNHTNILVTTALLNLVNTSAALPGSAVMVGRPELVRPRAELVVFDFERGQAVLARSGRHRILIDCGSERNSQQTLTPFLQQRGVRSFDELILTHGDVHHIGGGQDLITKFRPRAVGFSALRDRSRSMASLRKWMASEQLPGRILRPGDRGRLGPDLRYEILFPPESLVARVADDKALVILIHLDGWKVLLMSDVGPGTAEWLLNQYPDLQADIVVLGRHHSGLGLEASFFRQIRPRLVIAGSANFPESEQLPPGWRKMIQQLDLAFFPLEDTGGVTIRFHEEGWKASGHLTKQAMEVKSGECPIKP